MGFSSRHPSLRAGLIHLVLLAVVPALGLILYSVGEQRRQATLRAENDALRIVRVISVSHQRLIDSTRQLLLALSRLPEVRSRDSKTCSVQFSGLLKHYPLYSNLAAAKPNGDLFCSGHPTTRAVNISDRTYFQRAIRERSFAVGDYQIGRVTGKATVNLAYPIVDDSGNLDGIVFAGLDLAWFNQIVAAAQLPKDSVLTVFDRQGTILARQPNPELWVGKRAPKNDVTASLLAKGEGVAEGIGPNGRHYLYGFTTVRESTGDSTLHLSIGTPADVALAGVDWELRRNLAALITVSLLALVAAWLGANALVLRPLNALITTTKRLGGGDLAARTGLRQGTNEIGRLAASLDQMAEMLETQRTEAHAARQHIQRNLERIKALHDIDMAITSTLDLRTMLNLLLEKIDLVLPDAIATVRLLNKATGELEPVACRNIDENAWRAGIPRALHGFAKIVLENKVPLTVANVQTDDRTIGHPFARRFGLVSYLGVPLIAKDDLLGVIAFYTKQEHSFDDEEIEFFTTLSGQLAMAIQNAKLYEAMRRSADEISALHALTMVATQSLNLQEVLEEALKKITEIFHFDVTRFFFFDADTEGLRIEAAFEAKPEFWTEVNAFRRGQGIVGKVAKTGEPFVFEDVYSDARYTALSQRQSAKKAGAHFLAALPLKTKLKIWGVMVCVGEEPRKLRPEEVNLLGSMANQIGIAVENATLYQQTATKAKELTALYSISGIASESLDINTVLRKTMDKVLEIFGFDAARIYLRQGEAGELVLVAHEGIPPNVFLIRKYQVGEGRVGKALQTGEPMIVEDMTTDPNYNQTAHNKAMLKAGFRSSFLIPLKVRREGLGVMNFLSRKPYHFSQSDLQLINSIVYHLGIAVGNANLFSQLKQKTVELEKANKGKDEFLGIISHELRTPLNVIKGYSELVQKRILGDINSEQEKALEKIIDQSADLLTMINGLLDATTIEADAVKVELADVDLANLLDELRSNYELPSRRELIFNWDLSSELPVVKTDREKLKAILQNLLNNAIKFTEKGSIALSVRHVPEVGAVEFKITDTGIGIPQEKIQSVFDMFQQVDSSVTRKYGGVGLGLYIVKKFTEILGGQIAVESIVGKGSTFTMRLPVAAVIHASVLQDFPRSQDFFDP
jgi:signal transduction histidine kinase